MTQDLQTKFNRTFGRRIGKSLSVTQKNLIEHELPGYKFNPDSYQHSHQHLYSRTILEIGFGMGEHFTQQMSSNPDALFIGAEVYLNGVAGVLKLAREKNLDNFLIWPGDVDLILSSLKPGSLDGVYILFPDPWHKRRYMKKRLLGKERLELLKGSLKNNGFLAFATDIDDYFDHAKNLILQDPDFLLSNKSDRAPHPHYIKTKYHQKAEDQGRTARFLYANKSMQIT